MTDTNYWTGRLSRRSVIRGGALAGMGMAGAALVGCGEDEEPSGGGGGTASPGGGGAATTAPSSATAAGEAKSGGTIRVGIPQGPSGDSLDPNRVGGVWTHAILMGVYDTLMTEDLNNDKALIGHLVESWEESPDYLSTTFKLRQDVTFHDGTKFNAEHVKFLYDRITDESNTTGSAKGNLGPGYVGTDVIDEFTAKVNLDTPNHTMLRRLTRAYFGVPSMAAVEEMGLEEFTRNPVGSGPFSFKNWVQAQQEEFVRNPDYQWGPAYMTNTGAPYLDELTFYEIPDPDARTSALVAGDIEVMEEVPPVAVASLADNSDIATQSALSQGAPWTLSFNTRLAPLDDVRVRQALEFGIDKQEIIDLIYFGIHEPGSSPLSPSSYGFHDGLGGMYPFDPAKAAELLDAAGWTSEGGGIRQKDGQPFLLSYISTFADVGQLVQTQLLKLGLDMKIEVVPAGTAATDRTASAIDHIEDYGTQQAGFRNEDPDFLRRFYHSSYIGKAGSGAVTFKGWSNPEADDLLAKQQATPNGPERLDMLKRVQELIMEDAVINPVFNGTKVLATRANVRNVRIGPINFYAQYNDAWLA